MRLARHPSLLIEAVRTWFAMSARSRIGPSPSYLRWRAYTAYGDDLATASAQDLVEYLTWRREMRSIQRWGRES